MITAFLIAWGALAAYFVWEGRNYIKVNRRGRKVLLAASAALALASAAPLAHAGDGGRQGESRGGDSSGVSGRGWAGSPINDDVTDEGNVYGGGIGGGDTEGDGGAQHGNCNCTDD